ncbi:MAG TPA: MauE/DoxX family redox-associated membrane protein [Bryobacteraceae bacterium]|nr:MauE/DoxX family redox-associated membrane protein [Bryobacteraceae bacterium]
MTKRSGMVLLLRLALAVVLLYAGYTKLRQPWLVFAMSIDAYGLLPEMGVLAVARTLPWIELGLGTLLLAGLWLRVASALTAAILAIFFGIMLLSYGKGMGIDCGCFGVGEALTAKTLARDGLLFAAAVLLTRMAWRRPSTPSL